MGKIKKLYQFLELNRPFAYEVQIGVYKSWLSYYKKPGERLYSLLHHAYYTQAQPKLDNAILFFTLLDPASLKSAKSFIEKFGEIKEVSYQNLFQTMREQSGWGNKTAALFTKNVYQIHSNPALKELRFWDDLPKNIVNDRMYLPVDEVIKFIFRNIEPTYTNFDSINRFFFEAGYSFKQMEVWDDLWYWGFITQRGSGEDRIFDFNEGKYWSLLFSDKGNKAIQKIKVKANKFISIINE